MREREGDEAYEFIFGDSDAITQQFYRNINGGREYSRNEDDDNNNNNNSYGSNNIAHPSTLTNINMYGHYYSSSSTSTSSLPLPLPVRRSRRRSLWRDILIIFITWLFSFISPSRFRSPSPSPSPRRFIAVHVDDRSSQQRSSHDIGANRERRGGNISGGLSEFQFNQLTTIPFQPSMEDHKCMICQSEYEMGDEVIVLPCTHKYHQHCIRPWLRNTKLCCLCKMEVNV